MNVHHQRAQEDTAWRSHIQFISSEWCHPSEQESFPFGAWAAAAECEAREHQNMFCAPVRRVKSGAGMNNNSYLLKGHRGEQTRDDEREI